MSTGCVCSWSTPGCCYGTTWVPYFVETPMWKEPSALENVPFWIWIVVACGAALVLLILILMCVVVCCRNRMCFWCCCYGFDSESQAAIIQKDASVIEGRRDQIGGKSGSKILYRYPDDGDADLNGYASSRMTANSSYAPRAQRLTSGRKKNAPVNHIDETLYDEARRSTLGISSYDARPSTGLAVVTIGGSASATAPPTGRASSVVGGYHSAAIQVAGGNGGIHSGHVGTTLSMPSTSIYPKI